MPDEPCESTEKSDSNRADVWQDCEHFRMSNEEHQKVMTYYANKGYPIALIEHGIAEVDCWLGDGNTPLAIKERNKETHYRRLYSTWVMKAARDRHFLAKGHAPQSATGGVLRAANRVFKAEEVEDTSTQEEREKIAAQVRANNKNLFREG